MLEEVRCCGPPATLSVVCSEVQILSLVLWRCGVPDNHALVVLAEALVIGPGGQSAAELAEDRGHYHINSANVLEVGFWG